MIQSLLRQSLLSCNVKSTVCSYQVKYTFTSTRSVVFFNPPCVLYIECNVLYLLCSIVIRYGVWGILNRGLQPVNQSTIVDNPQLMTESWIVVNNQSTSRPSSITHSWWRSDYSPFMGGTVIESVISCELPTTPVYLITDTSSRIYWSCYHDVLLL